MLPDGILIHRYRKCVDEEEYTFFPDDRELLAGGKQRKEAVELTSERLPEIVGE